MSIKLCLKLFSFQRTEKFKIHTLKFNTEKPKKPLNSFQIIKDFEISKSSLQLM